MSAYLEGHIRKSSDRYQSNRSLMSIDDIIGTMYSRTYHINFLKYSIFPKHKWFARPRKATEKSYVCKISNKRKCYHSADVDNRFVSFIICRRELHLLVLADEQTCSELKWYANKCRVFACGQRCSLGGIA